MHYFRYVIFGILAVVLTACGGGGNPGGTSSSPGTPTTTSKAAAIELFASAAALDSASTTGVTVTAVVKDASNNVLPGEVFAFSSSSGVLQTPTTTTDAGGKGVTTLSPGSDRSNRNITVEVKAGTISKSLVVPVLGTTVVVNGSSSLLVGAGASYTVSLKDSSGGIISGATLTVASTLANNLSATTLTTDAAGSASFRYSATNGGVDTLTVSGAGAVKQYPVAISTVDFAFNSPASGALIPVSTSTPVRVRLLSSGNGVAGQTINFSSTRGGVVTSSVVTDANGEATTNVFSSTAGPASITAQVASGGQTSLSVNFVAATPATIVLQTNVNAIAPNASGSTANRVALSAVVKDVFGNAVQGRTVNFSLLADTSGGSIENGTGTTDANGVVTASFIAGAVSTASNGVVVEATVSNTTPVVTSRATLTVSVRSLFISFAASNTIANLNENTYSKPFAIYVVDANGAPVANQTVAFSVYPTSYGKGVMELSVVNTTTTATSNGVVTTTVKGWSIDPAQSISGCLNEDANRDGILQSGEDTNGNGRLTPGLPGVVTPSVITDANGQATFTLNYGEQYALWVTFEITARASVAGTESSAVFNFPAAIAASDASDEQATPAGRVSPFGYGASSNGIDLRCSNPN